MKQVVRYQHLVIAGKLRTEIRITVDERGVEYRSTFETNQTTAISLFPIISIIITRPSELDENGNRKKAAWNPNDTLGMTKYNFPTFVNNLLEIKDGMKIPELYTYQGKRLELNEELAEKIRKVFVIGNTTVELSAVVIVPSDETRIEGIKIKFNNESSVILLTLNELDTLLFHLQHIDIDSIALLMYLNYTSKPSQPTNFNTSTLQTKVDILPKEDFIP